MPTRYCLTLFIFFLLFITKLSADSKTAYRVIVEGIPNPKLKKIFQKKIDITDEPETLLAFSQILAEDSEKLNKLAHYYGYYSADIRYRLSYKKTSWAIFSVELGPQYSVGTFKISGIEPSEVEPLLPGELISTKRILEFEASVIDTLRKNGYRDATIAAKQIVADAENHTLDLYFEVSKGPKAFFGPISIASDGAIADESIKKYLYFSEGQPYDPDYILDSERALEKTGLFSSVLFVEKGMQDDNTIPITLHVAESKPKTIGAGINYTTTWGVGTSFEWENQNINGYGDTLSFKTELWKKYQTAVLSFVEYAYKRRDIDLFWLLEYSKMQSLAYDSLSYSLSRLIQQKLSDKVEIGYGTRLEWLDAKNYNSDRTYQLLKLPLYVRWTNADNLLDPTKGHTLNVRFTPAIQALRPNFAYGIHLSSFASYISTPENGLTLATRITLGNIVGAAHHTIPPPDRFYGGSENILRGYRAFTAGPLVDGKIPTGGRSLLALSVETRFRFEDDFGWAFFYDIGNVYRKNSPKITTNQLQSFGAGIRYQTPIGPLRLDVAFPLNPRPHVDPKYQIFFSVGQSF